MFTNLILYREIQLTPKWLFLFLSGTLNTVFSEAAAGITYQPTYLETAPATTFRQIQHLILANISSGILRSVIGCRFERFHQILHLVLANNSQAITN